MPKLNLREGQGKVIYRQYKGLEANNTEARAIVEGKTGEKGKG